MHHTEVDNCGVTSLTMFTGQLNFIKRLLLGILMFIWVGKNVIGSTGIKILTKCNLPLLE